MGILIALDRLIARASSPDGAPPATTQRPTPTPTNTAPRRDAARGWLAISGCGNGTVNYEKLAEQAKSYKVANSVKDYGAYRRGDGKEIFKKKGQPKCAAFCDTRKGMNIEKPEGKDQSTAK